MFTYVAFIKSAICANILCVYIYIYIYICVCVCVCIYIYIYFRLENSAINRQKILCVYMYSA